VGAHFAARAAWRLRPKTRQRVIRNILPACDGNRALARRLSRAVLEHVADYYLELLALPAVNVSTLERDLLQVVNRDHLAILASDEPVIAVSAHMGSPELAIQGLLGRQRAFVAIIEPLIDRAFAARLLRLRESAGGKFVEATPGGMMHAIRALRRGAVLGMMGDRDLQGTGVCVTLLERRVRVPRGPWEIARRTGSVVLPGFCARLPGGRVRVTFEEPFRVDKTPDAHRDIVTAAQRWVSLFERHLRSDPGQWVVLEDFWANHACMPASG